MPLVHLLTVLLETSITGYGLVTQIQELTVSNTILVTMVSKTSLLISSMLMILVMKPLTCGQHMIMVTSLSLLVSRN